MTINPRHLCLHDAGDCSNYIEELLFVGCEGIHGDGGFAGIIEGTLGITVPTAVAFGFLVEYA